MADENTVPADPAEVAVAAERVMDAANRLELGGIIFLLIVGAMILIGFGLWLWSKSSTRKSENERMRLEQEAKNERARLYNRTQQAQVEATNLLSAQIAGMREDASEQASDLHTALNDQSTRLTTLIQEHEEGGHSREMARDQRLSEVFSSLQQVMRELLDRQKGVINFDDAVRIINECFTRSIKPQAKSIAAASLKNNHWSDNAQYIEERVKTELQSMLYHAEQGLGNYQLSVDHKLFFEAEPQDAGYKLGTSIWDIIRNLHLEGTRGLSLDQRLNSSEIRIENAINNAFNEALSVARTIYRKDESGGGGTRRFNTPRPDDSGE